MNTLGPDFKEKVLRKVEERMQDQDPATIRTILNLLSTQTISPVDVLHKMAQEFPATFDMFNKQHSGRGHEILENPDFYLTFQYEKCVELCEKEVKTRETEQREACSLLELYADAHSQDVNKMADKMIPILKSLIRMNAPEVRFNELSSTPLSFSLFHGGGETTTQKHYDALKIAISTFNDNAKASGYKVQSSELKFPLAVYLGVFKINN